MAVYVKKYNPPYTQYKDLPDQTTPITASVKNNEMETLKNIETFLNGHDLDDNDVKISGMSNALEQMTNVLKGKADSSAVYTKSEVYAKTETYAKSEVYNKTETYTKNEVEDYVAEHGGGGGEVPEDIVLWENPSEIEIPAIPQPLHRFSAEEKVVGYWVNGKPLYERTLVFDNIQKSSTTEISIDHGIADVEYMFTDYTNTMFLQSDGHASPINVRWSTTSMSAYDSIIFGAYTGMIRYRVGASTAITGLQITVRYTKTTDRGND